MFDLAPGFAALLERPEHRFAMANRAYFELVGGRDIIGRSVADALPGRDVTERKRFERHQQLLVGELNHRVKNTLAIVQSLAHLSFQASVPATEAIARCEGRLQALAAAHNLLT
jgi:hypothetical protein